MHGPIARAVMAVTACQLLADRDTVPADFSAWWLYFKAGSSRELPGHEQARCRDEATLTREQRRLLTWSRQVIRRARCGVPA
jgi:hypothetical protein